MSVVTSLSTPQRLVRVTRYAYGQLLLTSVHHAYGAYIYDSPWRLHVVAYSIVAAIVIGAASAAHRKHDTSVAGSIAFWVFCATTLAFPFGMIGFFEGAYNHVLKNVLYFGGVSPQLMQTMFPAPTYELPNNGVFEVTGMAQIVPAVVGILHLFRLANGWRGLPRSERMTIGDPRQHSWK